ncbi:MAG: LysR family transcriptional regulator [Bradyrhizobium sp.]|uniref:LysR family transcriptional regulator n=1 Tax=Bradyrhizobium sp. TaxID=376 RepID=UPI001D454267|nr:LysR family transcriptional regulator [Bradyrhizobium sp.]MBV9559671.1 LysR family transcriptional regulator [Bradyrhizobium sp.]
MASIPIIEMTDLRLFDLNLLVAFDALMSERNVTRAARRIGVGQPAMSHALSRLRELFGDELFIRTSGSMQPTTRALELAGSIGRILGDIRGSVLADRAFRPEAADTLFHIGMTDYAEIAVLPPVLAATRSLGSRIRVSIKSIDGDRLAEMLETGAVDLAIGVFGEPIATHKSEVLFREESVCLFDGKACGVSPPLDLKTYLELPHIIALCSGESMPDLQTLPRRHACRLVVMATPHLLAIPLLLHDLRAVAAVPRQLAVSQRESLGLDVSPMPLPSDGFELSMHWHLRTDSDPAHRWFRDIVRTAAGPKANARSHLS